MCLFPAWQLLYLLFDGHSAGCVASSLKVLSPAFVFNLDKVVSLGRD